ncbi:hypothetical protein Ahy_A03g013328 [Arachis hypogaea]|uniref:Zinc finger GRF-type domain-containing protein n=1 Tax=Arachis hypogaea TaxID=3818 RepID=A0A445DV57_ARAHY|nr:hypothetical protein Ahy_A03g013328 [Arachis hypogaea]
MATTSNAAGSSNNPRSFGSIMRRMNRNREARLPEWCACGLRPVLRWSGTDSNPGRPFLGCPNYNVNRWEEMVWIVLWVDKVLEDAMPCDDRTRHSVDDEEWKMKMAWKFGKLEAEFRLFLSFCLKEMKIKVFDYMDTSVPGLLFNEIEMDST